MLKSRPEYETVNKWQPASWMLVEFFCAKVVGKISSEGDVVVRAKNASSNVNSSLAKSIQQGVALTGRNHTGPPCNVTIEL